MTSHAERLRRKKAAAEARISLAGGQSIPQRATGRDRRHTNQTEDATATVAKARQRHTGIKDAKDALQPINSTDMGRCIRAMATGDDLAALIDAWEGMSAARRNYKARIIGNTGEPQCAALEMIPDRIETDQSLRVDIRTPEQKDAAAKSAWAEWEKRINALPVPSLKWALRGALNGFMGEGSLWRDAAPTVTGRTAVQALRMVAGA